MPRFNSVAVIALAGLLVLPGCKFIKTADQQKEAAAGAFDPDKLVAGIWNEKVIPYLNQRAGSLKEVMSLATTDLNAAAAKYGHKEKQGNAPWTFAAKIEGTIVAEETKSRAAYVDVDVDGDTKADARVAIGPAIRGTALRDSLDFVNFNEFKNQIEWAQFGKSFNEKVNATVLASLPRDALPGKTVKVTGAFPLPTSGQLPLVTPATFVIGQ